VKQIFKKYAPLMDPPGSATPLDKGGWGFFPKKVIVKIILLTDLWGWLSTAVLLKSIQTELACLQCKPMCLIWRTVGLSDGDLDSGHRRVMIMGLPGYRHWTLGSLYAQFGGLAQALTHYRMALRAFQSTQDSVNVGHLLNRMGELHALLANDGQARILFQEAIGAFQRAGDAIASIPTLRNLGMLHQQQHCSEKALELLEQALALCDQAGDQMSEAITLTCLAQIYMEQQKFFFALCCCETALDLYRSLDAIDQVEPATYHAALVLCYHGQNLSPDQPFRAGHGTLSGSPGFV
jgi:tetratricopeptide (TPR) repeat protein